MMRPRLTHGLSLIAIQGFLTCHAAPTPASATPPANETIEEVTVAATPLGGFELPLDRIPANIQRATSEDIERAHSVGLAQFMDQQLGGVFINEAQNNPLQPDVQFRGFVASPLLGQPQGIAVYQNGVRINDPFGDIVNWALVPEAAIDSVDLIPGSNPVFGLNALGGAISLHTKTGRTHPGTQAEILGGSFGRVVASVESGGMISGRTEGLSYYASARYFDEDGWREHSPSDATHLFADLSWRNDTTSLDLNVTRIETDLIGNGPAPVQLLDQDRDAIYTSPDRTQNSMTLVALALEHRFAPDVQLRGVAYWRRSDIEALNGDESDFEECEFDEEILCDGDGEIALDGAGEPIAFDAALEGAALNRSSTQQDTYGVAAQIALAKPLAGHDNRLILGTSLDRSSVDFGSNSELGTFDEERRAIPGEVFVGDSFVDLDARTDNLSLFLTDTFAVTDELDLTLSARYNDTAIELRDQLGTELNGDHTFRHFNSAVGITYRVNKDLGLYASYSESNRAPSPVELTCADSDDPCALPNAFLADPPLEQVIARTFEVGARGTWRDIRWHASLFDTGNENDILFISAGALTNRGYFDNVGDTRRQGIELSASGKLGNERLSWFANFTYLRAQFLESFNVLSPHNPAAIDGEIAVENGDRLPSVPDHMLSAGANFKLTPALSVGVDVKHQSSQYLRGDEGNLTSPLSGYTTVNAGAEWNVTSSLTLFAQVENLFDEDYATFGLYGAADEVLGNDYTDPRFISPAPPLSAWVGFRWTL